MRSVGIFAAFSTSRNRPATGTKVFGSPGSQAASARSRSSVEPNSMRVAAVYTLICSRRSDHRRMASGTRVGSGRELWRGRTPSISSAGKPPPSPKLMDSCVSFNSRAAPSFVHQAKRLSRPTSCGVRPWR